MSDNNLNLAFDADSKSWNMGDKKFVDYLGTIRELYAISWIPQLNEWCLLDHNKSLFRASECYHVKEHPAEDVVYSKDDDSTSELNNFEIADSAEVTMNNTTEELIAYCPLSKDGYCHPNCMMLLTHADSDTVHGATDCGEGNCAFALIASHIASDKHYGGNYLMKAIGFDYREGE